MTPDQAQPTLETDWDAEYHFWRKLICDEVERTRFNDGFEPIQLELYPAAPLRKKWGQPDFAGQTLVGRRLFYALGNWSLDQEGNKVLKVRIFPKTAASDWEQLHKWAKSSARLYNEKKTLES